jgi:hypothetical protein
MIIIQSLFDNLPSISGIILDSPTKERSFAMKKISISCSLIFLLLSARAFGAGNATPLQKVKAEGIFSLVLPDVDRPNDTASLEIGSQKGVVGSNMYYSVYNASPNPSFEALGTFLNGKKVTVFATGYYAYPVTGKFRGEKIWIWQSLIIWLE